MESSMEGEVMAATARVEGGGEARASHPLRRAPMYQSVPGFRPFKRARAGRIYGAGVGGGFLGGGKVIAIPTTPMPSPRI